MIVAQAAWNRQEALTAEYGGRAAMVCRIEPGIWPCCRDRGRELPVLHEGSLSRPGGAIECNRHVGRRTIIEALVWAGAPERKMIHRDPATPRP
jgi:hypothetical protein